MQTATLGHLIAKNWMVIGIACYAAWSTAVDSLDEPTPASSQLYRWFYRFAHTVAFNLFTAFGKTGRTPWPGETPGQGQPPKQ